MYLYSFTYLISPFLSQGFVHTGGWGLFFQEIPTGRSLHLLRPSFIFQRLHQASMRMQVCWAMLNVGERVTRSSAKRKPISLWFGWSRSDSVLDE